MTAAGDLIGGRYRVQRSDRALGGLRRLVAGDTHLDRTVLAWVSDESGPEEDALLGIARAIGQAPSASFLHVLDVTYEDAGVAVILESPGPSLARVRGTVPMTRRAAAELFEAVDRAASEDALRLARIAEQDVFVVDGEVIVDPIALFLPLVRGEAAATLDDLVALLVERAEDGESLARSLRGGSRSGGASSAARAAAVSRPVAATPYVDDEPTAVFTPRAATPIADRPASSLSVSPPAVSRATVPPATAVEIPATPEVIVAADAPGEVAGAPRRGALPWRVFIPMYGALAVVVVGVLVFALRSPSTNPPATPTAAAGSTGAPAVAPGAGKVTVGLAATEDSGVRVTVDDIVQFDGTLKAGQRQSWEGKQRVDVWTDKGKTLLLAVNGKDLGPYSPAMGHADWNRIDFSFWPGFGQ